MKPICILLFSLFLVSQATAFDITAKVLSPDGKPVKNATVYYVQYPHDNASSAPHDAPTTRSDDTGAYHFAGLEGNGELIAAADGLGLGTNQNATASGSKDLHLTLGTDATVTFVTSDKKPVANIRVSVRTIDFPAAKGNERNHFWIPGNVHSPITATTDANGVCTIPGLPQGAQCNLGVDDDRFANPSYSDQLILATAPKTVQADPIVLQIAGTISGKVTGADGKPAPGINVIAADSESGILTAVTAPDGTYTIKKLRPGQYTVGLNPDPDFEKKMTANAIEKVLITSGVSKTDANLTIIPGVELNGSAIAADDGSGVAGVVIGIYSPAHPRDGSSVLSVTTDNTGHFATRVPPGECLVYIMSQTPADGFGSPSPNNKTITIADGGTGSVEFRLPRVTMSPIKGKVVDPDGNPVAGATVFASLVDSPMFQRNPITTNPDGTFQTMPMARTGKIEIRARAANGMATPKAIVITRASSGDLVIQLQKDALSSITGRVIDPQGQPIKGAKMEIITQTNRYSFGDDAGTTDDNGAFKVENLWPDSTYYIEANASGYGEAETAQVHLQPGQPTAARDLTLYKKDSSVAGTLLDADDKPQAGVRIYINGPRSGYNNLTTDKDGKFSCSVVSGDRLTVFYNVGRGYNRQPAKAGDQNIVLHTAQPKTASPAQRAHIVETPAATPANSDASSPTPLASTYNPADAVTWTGWLYAAILLVVGGAITVIANTIASLRNQKPA